MTTAPDANDQHPEEDFDLTPEEEDELERRYEGSLEAEREGRLIPWEALFPPRRQTG